MSTQTQIRVADLMTTPLETISQDATLEATAAAMHEKDMHALLVTTAPPSIVTSTDILDAVARGEETSDLDVTDVMTESVETVPPGLPINEAAQMMTTYGISHLPVVEDDYIGMISKTDITTHLSD
ncbi:MAG: cyclic nucleotide-binding/CBS domain-containing protein [Halorientalis sp.]